AGDLGGAAVVEGKEGGKQMVELEVPTEKEDINALYDEMLRDLAVRPAAVKQKRDAKTKKDDYYKLFRTRLVLTWMFSNALLIVWMTSDYWEDYVNRTWNKDSDIMFNPYLTMIFWS